MQSSKVGFSFKLRKMENPNNNLDCFINKGYDKKAAFKAERDNQVSKYEKKSYVGKLIDVFKSDKTPTSNYWMEVGE